MNTKQNLMKNIHTSCSWKELSPGGVIYGSGNSSDFNTGDWRTSTPKWHPEKCKQCLLCYPVCPDSSIPVESSKRGDFDLAHCKGCGICSQVCPFGAITFQTGEEE